MLFLMNPLSIQVRPLLEHHAMLSCSMSVVRRFSTTFEAQCEMFLAQLSKDRCMVNVMKFFLALPKGFSTLYHVMDIMLCFPWEGYTPEICV